jgi:tetratricopeptide (TPR) repeat protein
VAIVLTALGPIAAVAVELLPEQSTTRESSGVALRQQPAPLREIDPFLYLSVSRSVIAERFARSGERPPYVARDIDAKLDDAIGSGPLVVVVGVPLAGKSRSAFEAGCRVFGGNTAIVPTPPPQGRASLRNLLADALPRLDGDAGILWLDDLWDYLVTEALDADLLTELSSRTPRTVVVGSLDTAQFMALQGWGVNAPLEAETTALDKRIRRLLRERAVIVELAPAPASASEQRALAAAYPGLEIPEAVGLGAFLASAPAAIQRLRMSRSAYPEGAAVTQAVIDWQRAGVRRLIRHSELRMLFELYLTAFRPKMRASDRRFKEGLRWALSRPGSSLPLVSSEAGSAPAYRALGYVVSAVDGEVDATTREPIAALIWDVLVDILEPSELLHVGDAASLEGNHIASERALQRASETDDPDVASAAACHLGILQSEQGRPEEAEATWAGLIARFRHATDDHVRLHVGEAYLNTGATLTRRGRYEEAFASWNPLFESYDGPERDYLACMALRQRGYALGEFGQYQEALDTLDKVLRLFGTAADPRIQREIARTLVNKGFALGRLARLDDAIGVYDELVAQFGDAADPCVRESVAQGMANKTIAASTMERWQQSIDTAVSVMQMFGDADAPGIREETSRSLVQGLIDRLGLLRYEEAADAAADFVDRFGQDTAITVRRRVAKALGIKQQSFYSLGLMAQAEGARLELIARFADEADLVVRGFVATALLMQGNYCASRYPPESALEWWDRLIVREGAPPANLDVAVPVARALGAKGHALVSLGRYAEGTAALSLLADAFRDSDDEDVRIAVASAIAEAGLAFAVQGALVEAIAAWGSVLQLFDGDGDAPMRGIVAAALVNQAGALRRRVLVAESLQAYETVISRFGDDHDPKLMVAVARAQIGRAEVWDEQGNVTAAVELLDDTIARLRPVSQPEIQELAELAMATRAVIAGRRGLQTGASHVGRPAVRRR